MKKPDLPLNEAERLKALTDFDILDSESNKRLNNLVYLASTISDCEVSLVSLVDRDRQWFLAKHGTTLTESPRDISFCGHAINQDEIFEIENTLEDERFSGNPLVTDDPSIRFYAGKPLKTSDGFNIGTLCVLDRKPKKLSAVQKKQLEIISDEIMHIFEVNKKNNALSKVATTHTAFITSMSHELRTPLTSILGYVDVLEDGLKSVVNPSIKNAIDTLKSNSNYLLDLIGDILDFSKLESNKLIQNTKMFSTKNFFKQTHNLVSINAINNNVTLKMNISKNMPSRISTDSTLLKQILVNLLSNAIKFSRGKTVDFNIEFNKDEKRLIVDVIDTGIGMDVLESKQIFHPFEQANAEILSDFKGTGLGLAISREISDLLGGTIELVSTKINKGSHFRLELPLVEFRDHSQKNIISIDEKPLNSTIKKVLIADDIYENRFLFKHYMRDYGYQMVEAESGQQAIELFDDSIDAVFLDLSFPDMTGFEAYGKLNAQRNINQKIIAFSASTDQVDKDRCREMGFDGFVSKPFNTQSIADSLFKKSDFNHA
jgi:signal transduction histidine kinase/CheY-like chemotaxis protein